MEVPGPNDHDGCLRHYFHEVQKLEQKAPNLLEQPHKTIHMKKHLQPKKLSDTLTGT